MLEVKKQVQINSSVWRSTPSPVLRCTIKQHIRVYMVVDEREETISVVFLGGGSVSAPREFNCILVFLFIELC